MQELFVSFIFKDLLISGLFIILFNFFISPIRRSVSSGSRNVVFSQIYIGILGCVLSVVVFFYGYHVPGTDTLMDLRFILLTSVYVQGGFVGVIITAIFQIFYRILIYGYSISAFHGCVQIIAFIFCFHLMNQFIKNKWIKRFGVIISVYLITNISYFMLLFDLENTMDYLLIYNYVIIITIVVQYILLDSIEKSNQLYIHYQNSSQYDFLTGLSNAKSFDLALNNVIHHAIHKKEPLSCLMIDIDFFKKINDTYGHAAGDMVLQELARKLKEASPEHGVIGRVGGEEFCILLTKCKREVAYTLATKINDIIQYHPISIEQEKPIYITISIGVANYPESTKDLNQLKELSDMALYDAKHSGRNKVCIR